MLSHGLRQLFDAKLVASCQQTCCKLIVQTRSQQAYCKLFQQVITSLQMTKVATSPILTGLLQLVDKQKDCGVWLCTLARLAEISHYVLKNIRLIAS